MTRVALQIPALETMQIVAATSGVKVADAATSVYVYTDSARTVAAVVYAAPTGATTPAQPLAPTAAGAVSGYVDGGLTYYWQAGALAGQFEAVSAADAGAAQLLNVTLAPYNAAGDATHDDGPALEAAFAAGTPYLPAGHYRVNATIHISRRDARAVGDAGNRYDGTTNYGSQILFYGTGPLFEIGTDNGDPWDANDYDGVQGFRLDNIALSHNGTDTALARGQGTYKAGSYGIRDWRGGSIVLNNVLIEHFEYNFWGVQSDINQFHNVTSLYSKYGLYLGPRSDQNSIYDLYAFSCDTALTLDQCKQVRLLNPQIVGCGSAATYPVDIRGGTTGVLVDKPWFEFLQGYNGEVIAFVAAGITAGYDGVTTATEDVALLHPTIACTPQTDERHVKYLVAGDDCTVVADQVHGSVNNLAALFGGYGAHAGNYLIRQLGNAVNNSNLVAKNGSGTPNVAADLFTLGGRTQMTQNTRWNNQANPLAANAGESTLQITAELPRVFQVLWPNSVAPGSLTRIAISRRFDSGAAAPTTGWWDLGDRRLNTAPSEVGSAGSKYVLYGWICTAAGTPGTWLECRVSTGN